MRSLKRLACALLLSGLVAAILYGCGRIPTAPTPTETAPTGSLTRSAQPEGLISTVGGVVDGLVGLIVKTLNLVGSLGGSLTNGRWRLVVPPDAVDGTATITLGVSSQTSSKCQLEIWPPDKNHFSVPATLTADCRYVSTEQLRNYVILWYDPATKQWVPVEGSRVDLTTKTVSAPLLHFSTYAVGTKAGW